VSQKATGATESAGRLARRLAPVLIAVVVASVGCGGERGSDVPKRFVDGSPVRTAAIRFEDTQDPVVVTVRHFLDVSSALAIPRLASCLRAGWSSPPAPPVVQRVGVSGESVTFPSRSGHTVQACDGAGERASAEPWCGHVFGRPVDARLRDPRLDLGGCRTRDGEPLAFVWVEPGPGTRYVVVDRLHYSEAYAVSEDLPIRVSATEQLDPASSRAVVSVSEHSPTGRVLRRYELEAVVSG
jgi:hypothetical protein